MKKRFHVAPILLAVVLAIHSPDAAADCTIDQPIYCSCGASASPGQVLGQSFVACQTGFVTSITMHSSLGVTVPATLGLQAGTNLFPQSSPQSVNFVPGINTVILDTPFAVTSGTLYSFGLAGPTFVGMLYTPTNPYAGGTLIVYVGSGVYNHSSQNDVAFSVEISTGPVSTQPATWGSVKALYH